MATLLGLVLLAVAAWLIGVAAYLRGLSRQLAQAKAQRSLYGQALISACDDLVIALRDRDQARAALHYLMDSTNTPVEGRRRA